MAFQERVTSPKSILLGGTAVGGHLLLTAENNYLPGMILPSTFLLGGLVGDFNGVAILAKANGGTLQPLGIANFEVGKHGHMLTGSP